MWQQIHGHDAVAEQFRRSFEQGRLGSSYLFLGPEGVGKRRFALALAKTLLCGELQVDAFEPCGRCESCRLLEAGNHPDLDLVQLPSGKRRLPVELFLGDRDHRNQVGLCHNVSLRPMMGRRRVAIIDDADFLTTESANCLLKTLEEPPPGAVLILLGTSRGRQLPTILSRTQIIRFAPLAEATVQQLLLQQQVVAEASQAAAIAPLAEGSMKRAAELADASLWEFRRRLPELFDPRTLDPAKLTAAVSEFVDQAGKEAEARRQRLRIALELTAEHFRPSLRRQTNSDPAGYSAAQATEALECTLEAESHIDRNANQATLIEAWLDQIVGISLAVTFD
jgi:DNA polymerase-3 subunit delta'